MKRSLSLLSVAFVTGLCGCGGGGDGAAEVPAAPPAQPTVTEVAPVTPGSAPAPVAPPSGSAPAAMLETPDPLEAVKVSRDGSPNKSDLEALQAVVDAYSIGVDGLGAPAIASLDALVAKGFLKKIPSPPPGKKWAYDSAKWKVSLVDQ